MREPPPHRISGLSTYERGTTTVLALSSDPRFSYCLYVPEKGSLSDRSLLSVIHGSYRNFTAHRDQFRDFAETHNCLILAPLFPGNVLGDGNLDGFKYMVEGNIRYDRVLESMVEEVAVRYEINDKRFGLVGFSGGAHFAHRFLLLRPERLWGVSVGAPGSVTLLDRQRDWWIGVRDLEERFGATADPRQIARVPIQLVVGDADLDTQEILHRPGRRYWAEGANEAGATRPERLRALKNSLSDNGIEVSFDLLPGVGHEAEPIFASAQTFLAQSLAAHRDLAHRKS
ncbi:MAG: alpha/beta hydrolase [Rhizobiaceae bacterium]|nr:alpha/beta hydrolase [Rhizobiaceae bacterium]